MNNPLRGDAFPHSGNAFQSTTVTARSLAAADDAGTGTSSQPLPPAAGVLDQDCAHGRGGQAVSLARFHIAAEIETSVLPRLLNQFALRGLIPADLRAWIADERLHVDLAVAGLSERECNHLVQRLGTLVPVHSVDGAIVAE